MTAADIPPIRPRFRLTRAQRVLKKRDFERAMKGGLRLVDAHLMIWFGPNDLPHARLGLVVGRRHGGAVVRNRIKRLIREAFRLSQYDLPTGLDLIIAPKVGVPATLAEFQRSITALSKRAQGRLR